MSEIVNTEPTGTEEVAPVVEPADEVTLASDTKAEEDAKPSYEDLQAQLDELRKKNESAEELAKRLKDEKSQSKREEINQSKEVEAAQAREAFINENITTFIEQGMTATPEQLAEAAKYGITPEQIELSAYKAKENVARIYGIVGGKEQYNNMLDVMSEYLTEAQKDEYTKAVLNPNLSDYAVKGLLSDYQKIINDGNVDKRITVNGSTTSASKAGYTSEQEYYSDMRAMRALPSNKQKAYHAKITEKLNKSSF